MLTRRFRGLLPIDSINCLEMQPNLENMNVSIPGELAAFVDARTKGRFGNRSEYIRHLIREDQARAERERLERLLIEGLESGQPTRATPEFWEGVKREVLDRLRADQGRA